jgi:hypothetical protein
LAFRTLALTTALCCGIALPAAGQSREARFWKWFQANDSAVFTIQTAREPIADELARELNRIHPDLTFEVGPVENGTREFVLSADGSRDAFPAVLSVGRAAPEMPHWRVIMFRPPRPEVTQLRLGTVELDANTVEFLAEPEGGLTGLILSIPGYKSTPRKDFERAAFLLLDGMLGEFTVETGIGSIQFTAPSQRPVGKWQSLSRIQEAVPVQAPK